MNSTISFRVNVLFHKCLDTNLFLLHLVDRLEKEQFATGRVKAGDSIANLKRNEKCIDVFEDSVRRQYPHLAKTIRTLTEIFGLVMGGAKKKNSEETVIIRELFNRVLLRYYTHDLSVLTEPSKSTKERLEELGETFWKSFVVDNVILKFEKSDFKPYSSSSPPPANVSRRIHVPK